MRRLILTERDSDTAGRFFAPEGIFIYMIIFVTAALLLCCFVKSSAGAVQPAGGKGWPIGEGIVLGGKPGSMGNPGALQRGGGGKPEGTGTSGAGQRGTTKGNKGRDRRDIDPSREMDRAGRLIKDRHYENAAYILEKVCEDNPQILAAAEMLARCYMMIGRPQDAVVLLEKRIEAKPDHFAFVRELGNAYLDLGLKEKALEAWNRVLTGKEESAGYYGIVAKLEREAGLYEEALETLREGRKFGRHFARYTMDIIRLERMLGRGREAFREGIIYLTGVKEPGIDLARFMFDIFRESGRPETFLAAVDSAAAGSRDHGDFLKLLGALLMADAGQYGGAGGYIKGDDGHRITEKEFYTFLSSISGMRRAKKDGEFDKFFESSLRLFLERHFSSPSAPAVILIEAFYKWESARGRDSLRADDFAGVVALADSAIKHPRGAPYVERAAYLKAAVQLEDLHMPGRALETLDRVSWRGREHIEKVEELRARALLASGRWRAAHERLSALSSSRDSTIAAIGLYSLGRLEFLSGRYGKAVEGLSAFAEKYPWSRWANDALGTAMMVKGAMDEEGGALNLYREAIISGERGNFDAAIDSLEALQARYAGSMLAPRAIFLEAELEESAGRKGRAKEDYRRLAELFPLHELAPRALERIGMLLENARPGEAIEQYAEIMERYPDDPFLDRVRNRYMALKRGTGSTDGGDEEGR